MRFLYFVYFWGQGSGIVRFPAMGKPFLPREVDARFDALDPLPFKAPGGRGGFRR